MVGFWMPSGWTPPESTPPPPSDDEDEEDMADINLALLEDPETKAALLDRLHAEARRANALAEVAELEARKKQREEDETLASNKHHFVYDFNTNVNDTSVATCIERLTAWSRLHPGCDMTIIFDSPGGGIVAGFHLFDYIQELRGRGHYITTKALGMAASMAGVLLQAGDKRVIGQESIMLIHEASFGALGKIGEVEDTVDLVKRLMKRILKIFAERSKLSTRQIAAKWKRKDWWLLADEALKLGFVDEVQ